MKKGLYFLTAITLVASSAMASKARQKALSNTTAITDIQSIFLNPADVHYVGDFATFEMGDQDMNSAYLATDPDAEGGFLKTMGDSKFGFYLGKTSANVTALRAGAIAATAGTFLSHENPFEVFYGAKAGDLNWALSFSYSNSNKKNTTVATDDQTQAAMGTRLGVKTDVWGAYANIGLSNTAKEGDAKFTGKSGLTLGGHYFVDTMKFVAKYDMAGAKADNAAGTNVYDQEMTTTTLGFTNAWKNEGNMAFYGLAYVMANTKNKVASTKEDESKMPFTLGAEVLATSWLKLRGSVSQNLLLGTKKTDTNGADTIAHDTTTAAGAGFVWGKNNLDVVMSMGTNGDLNSATFGTSAAYTYMF